jgi:hypothetical protein
MPKATLGVELQSSATKPRVAPAAETFVCPMVQLLTLLCEIPLARYLVRDACGNLLICSRSWWRPLELSNRSSEELNDDPKGGIHYGCCSRRRRATRHSSGATGEGRWGRQCEEPTSPREQGRRARRRTCQPPHPLGPEQSHVLIYHGQAFRESTAGRSGSTVKASFHKCLCGRTRRSRDSAAEGRLSWAPSPALTCWRSTTCSSSPSQRCSCRQCAQSPRPQPTPQRALFHPSLRPHRRRHWRHPHAHHAHLLVHHLNNGSRHHPSRRKPA